MKHCGATETVEMIRLMNHTRHWTKGNLFWLLYILPFQQFMKLNHDSYNSHGVYQIQHNNIFLACLSGLISVGLIDGFNAVCVTVY